MNGIGYQSGKIGNRNKNRQMFHLPILAISMNCSVCEQRIVLQFLKFGKLAS